MHTPPLSHGGSHVGRRVLMLVRTSEHKQYFTYNERNYNEQLIIISLALTIKETIPVPTIVSNTNDTYRRYIGIGMDLRII